MEKEPTQLFLEDFTPGQKYPGHTRHLGDADVIEFAALTGDRHPIHYDAEYAKRTRFGRPIAHGLHLAALTALGASPLSEQLESSMIAMLQQTTRFLKPVFVDDTVQSEFEVEAVEVNPDKGWGTVRFAVRLFNQRTEQVLEGHHIYRIRCRAKPASKV